MHSSFGVTLSFYWFCWLLRQRPKQFHRICGSRFHRTSVVLILCFAGKSERWNSGATVQAESA